MSAHARLGPSSSKKWLACTPSVSFEEQFQERESDYAREGTAAHEYAEMILRCERNGNDGADIAEIGDWQSENEFYDGEMEEAVGEYIDVVMERYNEALARSADAELFIEERLDFSKWVPEGFGTGDIIIISDGILEVIDLKYGKGVAVDAVGNPQLRLYGLGALAEYDFLYDITEVRMTIVQPRLNSVSTDSITAEDLYKWAEEYVRPRALLAWEGKGEFCPGEHCKSGFCKGRNQCKAFAEYNLELFKYDLVKANLLLNEDIAEILEKVDTLTSWAKSVKDYALKQAEIHGTQYPGWKLVEGRSNRKIADEAAVIQALEDDGYNKIMLYKSPAIETLGNLEKLVGKKHFTELCGEHIIKPQGKPVLVPESDRRPPFNTAASAAQDFAEED